MKNIKINNNFYEKILYETIFIQKLYKNYDIFGINDINNFMEKTEEIFKEIKNKTNPIIIKNMISELFKTFGTYNIENLLTVVFNKKYLNDIINDLNYNKFELIKQFVRPIGYKIMQKTKKNKKNIIAKNRIVEDFMIVDVGINLDCYDLARTSRSFFTKVFGIKIAFHNIEQNNTIIICGIIEDVFLDCIHNYYVKDKIEKLKQKSNLFDSEQTEIFYNFIKILTIKELLIYNIDELVHKFNGFLYDLKQFSELSISQIIKEFLNASLYIQRKKIITLLIKENSNESQYMAYLLYDLLSNENTSGHIDTVEQTYLYNSLPWLAKKMFRQSMKTTISYTKNLVNYSNNIPIEQQICLLKVNEITKEKAMNKLKEIKSKSEDSGSKAKQYLEGLLKIPFGYYKKEDILKNNERVKKMFEKLSKLNNLETTEQNVYKLNQLYKLKEQNLITEIKIKFKQVIYRTNKENLILFIKLLQKELHIKIKGIHQLKINNLRQTIINIIKTYDYNEQVLQIIKKIFPIKSIEKIFANKNYTTKINILLNQTSDYINNIEEILNNSIYGHKNAKNQIKQIIGQWITGKQSGYCFGFEGPPGVGKTSLAKLGLANCLKETDGTPRPFAFIALGGGSNASTLIGHNYTYVGSTWGRIVDILIEKKCMNPIIFIDELDKISRTEYGKELIGVLTHLTDSTQNEHFQDKYFSGIDIDLSKILFIFSYNDVSCIDRILLDRIHRIKFKSLTFKEKLNIVKKFILPEIYETVGIQQKITMKDPVIKFIINTYTSEAGVRKLKELLFEIIREINLKLLQNHEIDLDISIDYIKNVYLKEKIKTNFKKIQETPLVGVINGLWANSLGMGGIITIEAKWTISDKLMDLKLTGMQGDVMKESMNISKTLAWNMLTENKKKNISGGIHIHCPEGATPKDGPSAGGAITAVIYSLLTNRKINNKIGVTGEIDLLGNITAIGGLEYKIIGGIRAGITEFIYPKENSEHFKLINEKNKKEFEHIIFHEISNIKELFELIFV
ncbi:AAA family ATPase [bacterium]|nr:AAA family ATPase [bacterium]